MSRTLLVLILCLSALRLGASLGSRSILRTVADKNGDSQDYAVDLNATNFDAVLRDTPATFAVVEFFAHWLGILFLLPTCLLIRICSAIFFLVGVNVKGLCLLDVVHAWVGSYGNLSVV